MGQRLNELTRGLARSAYTSLAMTPVFGSLMRRFPAERGLRSNLLDSALGTKGLLERNELTLNRSWGEYQYGLSKLIGSQSRNFPNIESGRGYERFRDDIFHSPHRDQGFTLNRSKSELRFSQIQSGLAFIKESAENDIKVRDYDFYAIGHDPSSGEFPVTRESIINRNYSAISELFNPLSRLFERFRGW